MSLYKTLVCPGILYAVLALFLIKKGYRKSRKCAENSDRNGIWSKEWFLYEKRLNSLVLQIVGSWVRYCREILPHDFLWCFLSKHPFMATVRGTIQSEMGLWSEALQMFLRAEGLVAQPSSPVRRNVCSRSVRDHIKVWMAVKGEYSVVATGQSFCKCWVFGSCRGYCEQWDWASFQD